jgi:hypothetical protein
MRKFLYWAGLCGTVILSGCSPQQAGTKSTQPVPTSKPAGEVMRLVSLGFGQEVLSLRENRQLLAPVRALMPSGGISEFFGVCKGRFKSGNAVKDDFLMVHFYALPDKAKVVQQKDGSRKFALLLDLLTFDRSRKSARLRRLNRVALTDLPCLNGNWAHGSDSLDRVELLWIDARQQMVPTLKLQMSGSVMSGVAGCYALVAFPEGLQAKPVNHDFETYSQLMGGMDVSFSRDKQGLLVVRQDSKGYDMDFDKQKTTVTLTERTYFHWNGKAFVARKVNVSDASGR